MTENGGVLNLREALTGARVEVSAREGQLSKTPVTGTIEGMMNQLAEVLVYGDGAIGYPVVVRVNLDSPFVDRDYGMKEGVSIRQLFLFVYNVEQLAMLVKEGWTNESAIVAYRQREEGASSCEPQSRDDLVGVAKDVDLKLLSLAE
jgi:hypothetical protein